MAASTHYLRLSKRLVIPMHLAALAGERATGDAELQELLVVIHNVIRSHVGPRGGLEATIAASTSTSGPQRYFVNSGERMRFYYHFRPQRRHWLVFRDQHQRKSEDAPRQEQPPQPSDSGTVELRRCMGGEFKGLAVTAVELCVEMTNDAEPKDVEMRPVSQPAAQSNVISSPQQFAQRAPQWGAPPPTYGQPQPQQWATPQQFADVPAIACGARVTSSTDFNADHRADNCRLNFVAGRTDVTSSAWCAGVNDTNQWLQVSLETPRPWVAVAIQGRHAPCDGQFVEKFTVETSDDSMSWTQVDGGRVFDGVRGDNALRHVFQTPVISRLIRFRPISWQQHCSMRCEAYYNDGLAQTAVRTPAIQKAPISLIPSNAIPAIACGARVTSSTDFNADHRADNCRLNFVAGRTDVTSSAWCAGVNDTNQWLQVSLETPRRWIGVAIQGRGAPCDGQFVEKFAVETSDDSVLWTQVDGGRVFDGVRGDSALRHVFQTPVISRLIRFRPISWQQHCSMRCEAYYL